MLVIALLGATLLPQAPAQGAENVEPTRIALIPLVVHSADDRAYLRNGLRDMIRHRFAAIDEVDLIRIEDDSRATSRLPAALAIGREVEADFVFFGSFTRFGSGASLDVQCASTHAAEGEVPLREIFVYSGNVGDVIPDLDELVGKITRFAVYDYEKRLAEQRVRAGLPAPPDPLAELRHRVEVLEAALAELQGQPQRPVASPGEAGAEAETARTEASVR